jgi:hypothetical protein
VEFSTPKELGLLMFSAGGAKLVWFSTLGKGGFETQLKTLKGKLLGETGVDVDLSGTLQNPQAATAKAPGIVRGKSERVEIVVVLRRPIRGNRISNAVRTRNGPSQIALVVQVCIGSRKPDSLWVSATDQSAAASPY